MSSAFNASSSASISYPIGSSRPRRPSLLKRNASDAGLENGSGPRKSIPTSSSSTLTLQRRVLTLEGREREQEQKIEDQWEEIERLRGQRKVLLEGETYERETGEEREKEWSAERMTLSSQLKEIRQQNSQLSNSLAQLESEHAQLSNQHSGLSLNTSREIELLTSRLRDVEGERDGLRGWERRARGLSIDLEEARRKAEESRRGKEDEVVDRQVDETMRKELRRQAQYLVTLERNHAALQTEMIDLRQRRKETEANERASKDVERALREEIRTLQDQLDRSRRDMDSLTQTFPSSMSSPENASAFQQRLTTISNLHNQATSDLAARDKELRSVQDRLSTLAQNSTSATVTLTKRAEEAERELRWAKEGRQSAERREMLAKKEAELMTISAAPSMPGGVGPSNGDQAAKIHQLEALLGTYKEELEALSRDSRDVEAALTQGAGLVKQSALEEADGRIQQLERDIDSLESTISQLTSANTTLDAEVNDLMRRVASGEYNPALERCIELKSNPASNIQAVRTKQLDDLRRENDVLLDRLKSEQDGSGEPVGVPQESFERLRSDKEEMEMAHAKRLLRLKEIFGNKSKEFLEAVYSLLGWRIKFDESGADIRLTSMYAPKGKMGLTLKFASQEGHFGTMHMTGALAKGLEESRNFWIVERQSVPGFLAQVTTEMFEKTTIGRAAGYVGLE